MRLALVLALLLVSCRAWRDDWNIKTADECIKKKCTAEEVTAREECETTCKRRFKWK